MKEGKAQSQDDSLLVSQVYSPGTDAENVYFCAGLFAT